MPGPTCWHQSREAACYDPILTDKGTGAFASLLAGLGPVPKAMLFVGFIFLCLGLINGLSFHNRALMTGVALMSGGFAWHYWPDARRPAMYPPPDEGRGWNFGNFLAAILFTSVTVVAAIFAYRAT